MDQPSVPQIPWTPQQPTTHYRPADSNTFGCGLAIEYGTESDYAMNTTCAHCQIVLAGELGQNQDAINDEGQPMSADDIREGYNTVILEEALACQEPADSWASEDPELVGQIELVQQLFGQPGVDHAVDHLRVMLEISYLDASDLPSEIPAARGPVLAATPGAAHEVFTFTVTLTRAQLDQITSALDSMENNGPPAEARAAAILGGQIPAEYYSPSK